MRQPRESSPPLVEVMLDQLIRENGIDRDPVLEGISALLDTHPRVLELVQRDLVAGLEEPGRGRRGISAECVLRFSILMRVKNWTYREARERVSDSLYLRQFVRWGYGRPLPKVDALNRAVLRLSPETLERINDLMVAEARKQGVEDGSRSRVDTTVTESDIHHPSDSSLLRDAIRVLTRHVNRIREIDPNLGEDFPNRLARAKKLARRIDEVARKRGDDRAPALKRFYKDLLALGASVKRRALAVATAAMAAVDPVVLALAVGIEHYADLMEQVIVQTRRRVLLEEPVPAGEKIVSIFEPHTAIIRRGKVDKPTEYGRKVVLAQGASGIITHYAVLPGNPADVTLLPALLDAHQRQFGSALKELAGDRGFYSKENIELAEEKGVELVSIPKPGDKSADQVKLEKGRRFRLAQRFRAGIEGTISVLKRGRGIRRCYWHGERAFMALVGLSVLAQNLMLLGSHLSG